VTAAVGAAVAGADIPGKVTVTTAGRNLAELMQENESPSDLSWGVIDKDGKRLWVSRQAQTESRPRVSSLSFPVWG
jgi:hypothetical protein